MKKLALTFVLTLILTFTVIADDGNTHTGGGKNCPPEQTCLIGNGEESADLEKENVKEYDFIGELLGILKEMLR